jgi:DNA repair exonuclease SbcCD ATPase subunit
MRRAHQLALIAMVLLGLAGAPSAQEATPEPGPERGAPHQRPLEHKQDLSRQESQIRRTRGVTRRILRDRRASDEIRQQATELDALLDKRQQVIDRLEKLQKDFLSQHKAEIDEIDDLRRRAQELDERLSTARKDVLESAKGEVATLKDATTRAADIADSLRERYLQERRRPRQQ